MLLITANDTLPLWVTNVPITCGVRSPLPPFLPRCVHSPHLSYHNAWQQKHSESIHLPSSRALFYNIHHLMQTFHNFYPVSCCMVFWSVCWWFGSKFGDVKQNTPWLRNTMMICLSGWTALVRGSLFCQESWICGLLRLCPQMAMLLVL